MVRRTRFVLNLAFSQLHRDWLPSPSSTTGGGSLLKSFCEQSSISRIGFLRHGKTAPKPDGGVDFDRLLTDGGREQAMEAGSSFGRQLLPFYSPMLVSPAPRTVETAQLFLASASNGNDNQCEIQPEQVLYDGTMQPEGSQLFSKIGYAPISGYVDSEDPNDREVSRKVLGEYANSVVEAMLTLLQENDSKASDPTTKTTLWMVGHAIYLPAAALGVASVVECQPEGMETILSCNTQEAEGFLIDLETSQASYLTRPSSLQ